MPFDDKVEHMIEELAVTQKRKIKSLLIVLNHASLLIFVFDESAKLRALRGKNVFTCQLVLRAYVLTC